MIIAAVEIRLAEAERVELLDQFWMVPSPGICQSGGRPGVRLGLGTETFHFWPFGKSSAHERPTWPSNKRLYGSCEVPMV